MVRFLRSVSIAGIFISVLGGATQGQNMVVLDATKDNTIFSEGGDLSNGGGQFLFTGATKLLETRRALLQFDPGGQIPASAHIDSVKLTLKLNKAVLIDPLKFYLYRNTQSWGEAASIASGQEGKGIQAETGDATWSHRQYETVSWNTAGGDFETNPSDSLIIAANSGEITWSGEGLAGDVQAWITGTSENHGWILLGSESVRQSAKRFASREHSNAADRPKLAVYFSPATAVSSTRQMQEKGWNLFPNPFRDELHIAYRLERDIATQLAVYNLLGQQVKLIRGGIQPAGAYQFTWDGRDRSGKDVAPGIYYVILLKGNERQVQKVMKSR